MNTVQNAVAVLFPNVDSADVVKASQMNHVNILIREQYSETKDYTRFFKRSKRVLQDAEMQLLFIFPGGISCLAKDMETLKKALKRVAQEAGAFA